MPSRIIKESITTSESLDGVSADAERLFWRLVVKADDYGLYYGNPKILSSMCFPLNPPTEKKIQSWLAELVGQGMDWETVFAYRTTRGRSTWPIGSISSWT